MLHSVSTVLENSITSSTFSDSDLDILKNKTTTFLSNIELVILDGNGNGIKGSMSAIDSFDANYLLKMGQLQDAIKLAVEDLNLAKTGKDISSSDVRKNLETLSMSIKMKEDALRLAQVSISEVEKNRAILSSERESKLREIDAKLSETRMNQNLAENSIESGIIRAPFDGVILARNVDLGTIIPALSPIFSMTDTGRSLIKASFDITQTPLVI